MKEAFMGAKFGDMVWKNRVDLGKPRHPLPMREAAKTIGIGLSSLHHVEVGGKPDIDTFVKLCRWLGVSMDSILEGWNPE